MGKRMIPEKVFEPFLCEEYNDFIKPKLNVPSKVGNLIVSTDRSNIIRVPIDCLENASNFKEIDFDFNIANEHKMQRCDVKIDVPYLKALLKGKVYLDFIELCGVPFKVESLIKLLNVCDTLKEDFIYWQWYGSDTTIPNLFEVNLAEILIMPFYKGGGVIEQFTFNHFPKTNQNQ